MTKLFTPAELAILQTTDAAALIAWAKSQRQIAHSAQARSARNWSLKRAAALEAAAKAAA